MNNAPSSNPNATAVARIANTKQAKKVGDNEIAPRLLLKRQGLLRFFIKKIPKYPFKQLQKIIIYGIITNGLLRTCALFGGCAV